MQSSRTRILAILAGAVGAAALVAALSTGPWQGAPVLPLAPAAAAAATAPEMLQNFVAGFAQNPRTSEPAAAIERTKVPLDQSAANAPLGNEARVRLRATELAQRLGLPADDETTLTAVLLEEETRRAGALTELRRKPDDAEARARVRRELDAILAWKTEALHDQFGAEHATEILKRR